MISSKSQENKTGFVILDENGSIQNTSGGEFIYKNEDNLNDNAFYEDISRKIEKSTQKSIDKAVIKNNRRIDIVILMLFLILVMNTLSIFFNKNNLTSSSVEGVVNYINNKESKPVIPNVQNSRSINEFAGNSAITEIGSKISVLKNKIATNGNTNCKTPILPPEVNGCDFVLAPSLLGLPKTGIVLTSIQLFGNIQGQSLVQIDEKNYEKGILQKEVGKIESQDMEKYIPLPPDLDSTRALYFRLWEKDGPINIDRILIRYMNVDNLIPVSGKVSGLNKIQSQTASVYLDINENGIFDEGIDKIQECSQFFPGVQTIKFSSEGKFEMLRDSSCYKDSKPDSWFADNNKNALHPGKWLLVFPVEKKSMSFEIQTDQKSANLELGA